ncbi:MAG TPA: histidine phosphatase family protein [Acidimicrobiales bacterium]|jgi:probable phosphoglycerate mutase|nr:histidine phosphatase family protein [Acidimicrobiales bacterium]
MPAGRAVHRPSTVVLVRHGTTATTGKVLPGRAPGLHLSDRGTEQAHAVAAQIAALPRPPSAVYASPLERAMETAAPIAKALHLRVRTAPGLLECDFGDWTGARLSALRRRREWRSVQLTPSVFRFPRGESFSELQARCWDAVVELGARHRGETIVAVSHADPIKAIVAAALGIPLDLFQRTVVSTCSVTVLVVGEGAPIVLCVNSLADLAGLAPS